MRGIIAGQGPGLVNVQLKADIIFQADTMHSVFFSSSDAHRNTSSGSQGIYPCVKTLHEPPPLSRTLTLRSHPQHDDHKPREIKVKSET